MTVSQTCAGADTFPTVANGGPAGKNGWIGKGGAMPRGQWTKVGLHYKAASACSVGDGRIALYVADTVWNEVDWPVWDNTSSGVIDGGYIQGAANSGFDNATVWYIDDVKFYTTTPPWGS